MGGMGGFLDWLMSIRVIQQSTALFSKNGRCCLLVLVGRHDRPPGHKQHLVRAHPPGSVIDATVS